MLSATDVVSYLERVTYKPGWKIKAYQGSFEGIHIVIQAEVIDSYHPESTVPLDIHSVLPPMHSLKEFVVWLSWRLGRIENHEMREWLKEDGVAIFDPHSDEGVHDTQLRR